MFLSCPECGATYKLDELQLGPAGRRVRCTSCYNVWRAMPPEAEPPPPRNDGDPFGSKFSNDRPIAEEDMEISFDGDADAGFAPDEAATPEATLATDMPQDIPDVVKPVDAGAELPDDRLAYQPMGMSAQAAGLAMFLLPLLLTVALLAAFKAPLARNFPALATVYEGIGMHVAVPGEGLRLSALVAERKIDEDGKTLSLSAQLANSSAESRPYPALTATLYGPYGALLKTWDLPAPAGRTLASGEDAPIKVEFPESPDAGAKIILKVQEQ